MRYQGAASTNSLLLTAISSAAVAQGWTQSERYTEPTFSYDVLVLTIDSSFYWYIGCSSSQFYLKLSTSYTASVGWNSVPNQPPSNGNSVCEGVAGSLISHNIFAFADCVHVSCEISAGKFRHFSFGKIEKIGSYTGGEYVVGMNFANITADFENSNHAVLWDSLTGSPGNNGIIRLSGAYGATTYSKFCETTASYGVAAGNARRGFGSYTMRLNGPNTFNNRARYCPVLIFMSDSDTVNPTYWYPVGYVPYVRLVNNELLTEKEADPDNPSWISFPMIKKSASLGSANPPGDSYNNGIAYDGS